MVEQLDRLARQDRGGEQPHRHVRAAPRPIDREEAQAGRRQAKQVRVGMRHQLVRLLGGAVEAERMVDIVVHRKRHARIGAVDRGRRGIEQMPAAVMAAAFQDVGEAGEVGVDIGIRIGQRVTHAGLRAEMHDVRKAVLGEQLRHGGAVGEIAFDELEARQFGELGEPRLFQFRIVIGVEIVEADDAAAVAEEPPRDVETDEAGGAGDETGSADAKFDPFRPCPRVARGGEAINQKTRLSHRAAQQAVVQRAGFATNSFRRELRFDQMPAGRAEAAAQLGILGEPRDRVRQRGRIVRRHQQRVDVGAGDLAATGHVARDHRPGAGRRLQQDLRQPLAPRDQHGDMRRRPDRADVGDMAEQANPRMAGPASDLLRRNRMGLAGSGSPAISRRTTSPRPVRISCARTTVRTTLVIEQASDIGDGRRTGGFGQRSQPVGFDAGASNSEDARASDAECLDGYSVIGVLHQHGGAAEHHRSSERSNGRSSRACNVRAEKMKPRPVNAFNRTQRRPEAASEPTMVGCSAT